MISTRIIVISSISTIIVYLSINYSQQQISTGKLDERISEPVNVISSVDTQPFTKTPSLVATETKDGWRTTDAHEDEANPPPPPLIVHVPGEEKNEYWRIDPEAYMTVDEIIRYHGYPVIDYTITTEDGYIITVQRIPYGINGKGFGNETRKPVVIFPCLLCSAGTWVSNTKDKNLPYILADAGYDVWIGNFRGTLFGRQHVSLSPDQKAFWEFSIDEMAKYDVPAIIDTMLNVTGYKQVLYVAHSMGTTVGFAMLASQPKYNEIVKAMFALAPGTALTYDLVRSPFKYFCSVVNVFKFFVDYFGTGEVLPNSKFIKLMASTVCNSPLKYFCSTILFLFGGYDEQQLNQTRLPVYLHHTPAGTSFQNILHYSQTFKSGKFQYFDFGEKENEIRYGQPTPPLYDVTLVTTPVAIFWGENDYLSVPHDVEKLAEKLPNVMYNYRVPFQQFGHLDFLWAIDVKPLLYEKLVELMRQSWPN